MVAAIWTAPLAAGIKAAVTACVSVVVAVAIGLFVASALKRRGWGGSVTSTDSSGSGFGVEERGRPVNRMP